MTAAGFEAFQVQAPPAYCVVQVGSQLPFPRRVTLRGEATTPRGDRPGLYIRRAQRERVGREATE